MTSLTDALLAWFEAHARELPWRVPGEHTRRDPYRVVVSEMMLQQTQVVTVIPYFERFMTRFPTVRDLACADITDVLKHWEGLGYYRRARLLHRLARRVVDEFDGELPSDCATLLTLPGVGPYTAGAIASFAFDRPEPAVDGNVVRVFARIDATPYVHGDDRAKREVADRVRALMPERHAGDFSESLIELGATVCTPARPACERCPVRTMCRARAEGRVTDYPKRAAPLEKPEEDKTYVAITDGEKLLVRKRPPGLLGGLYEFVAFPEAIARADDVRRRLLPLVGDAVRIRRIGRRRAVFSHRIWHMTFWRCDLPPGTLDACDIDGSVGRPVDRDTLMSLPFPAFLTTWRDALGSPETPDANA